MANLMLHHQNWKDCTNSMTTQALHQVFIQIVFGSVNFHSLILNSTYDHVIFPQFSSDTFNQDLSRISDQEEEEGKETQLLGKQVQNLLQLINLLILLNSVIFFIETVDFGIWLFVHSLLYGRQFQLFVCFNVCSCIFTLSFKEKSISEEIVKSSYSTYLIDIYFFWE